MGFYQPGMSFLNPEVCFLPAIYDCLTKPLKLKPSPAFPWLSRQILVIPERPQEKKLFS
jgi:hypothetical protein